MYTYRAQVTNVVDGDTLDVRIDLGFYLTATHRLRLLGVNTPERGQEGWAAATTFVREWVAVAQLAGDEWPFQVRTAKADAFGRWLATVSASLTALTPDLSTALLESGHGVVWVKPAAR